MYKGFQSEGQMGRKQMSTKWVHILCGVAFEFNCRIGKTHILCEWSIFEYIYIYTYIYIYKDFIWIQKKTLYNLKIISQVLQSCQISHRILYICMDMYGCYSFFEFWVKMRSTRNGFLLWIENWGFEKSVNSNSGIRLIHGNMYRKQWWCYPKFGGFMQILLRPSLGLNNKKTGIRTVEEYMPRSYTYIYIYSVEEYSELYL